MTTRISRRSFLKRTMVAGAAVSVLPTLWPTSITRAAGANERLRIASIGVGGMGWSDISTLIQHPQVQIVGLCDVSPGSIKTAKEKLPDAKVYSDWRKVFADAKEFDAVTVSTPDHTHAPVAMTALNHGKHVYCQKPLTHEIYEARQLTKVAAQKGLVTQMGIQIHSNIEYRMAVQMIQEGTIGKVKEVHAWSDRPSWNQGGPRPAGEDPVPAGFDWDIWLGVAPPRPFKNGAYHPFQWRGVLDFGTGALGDMGCHIIDPPFTALKLTAPLRVWSEGPGATQDQHPAWETIHYEFPGTAFTTGSTVVLTWYDGKKDGQPNMPDAKLAPLPADQKLPSNGSIFVGEKGVMLLPHVGGPQLLPRESFQGIKRPQLSGRNHYHQWANACRGEDKASAGFDFAGPLTETVLLGVLAGRFVGQKLEWDAQAMAVKNLAAANQFLRREYRKGWEVENLS